MKKLLLTSAVVGGLVAAAASPAMAEVQLGLGGHMKGYIVYNHQDEAAGADTKDFDILRETEIHFTGETTLDNGLTVGYHAETFADEGQSLGVNESYAYFAGNWGRVNFGGEDGAAFLLQVAAPAADSNIDGIRQYINPVNISTLGGAAPGGVLTARTAALLGRHATPNGQTTTLTTGGGAVDFANGGKLDYAQDVTGDADKVTYITPVFYGFQAGVSYTPSVSLASRTYGVSADSTAFGGPAFDNAIEGAVRYEGQFQAARITLGAGYLHADDNSGAALLGGVAATDDRQAWNAGANVGYGPFNLGGAYKHDNNGLAGDNATKTWVVGADYTTGPFVIGASYFDQKDEFAGTSDLTSKREAVGVGYTYGPGMSFRGSVQHVKFDNVTAAGTDSDATSVLLGTQIGF